jgi:hypothetical protein
MPFIYLSHHILGSHPNIPRAPPRGSCRVPRLVLPGLGLDPDDGDLHLRLHGLGEARPRVPEPETCGCCYVVMCCYVVLSFEKDLKQLEATLIFSFPPFLEQSGDIFRHIFGLWDLWVET